MNKITSAELTERQGWNLDQKIDHSLGVIEQFYNYTGGRIVVMFSGGKDSTVLLHLVRRIYPDTKAVFVNTTNEFSEILRFVKSVDNVDTITPDTTFTKTVAEYGFPLVSKKVAKAIGYVKYPKKNQENVRNLVLTGINKSGQKCESYKLAERWRYLADAPFDITSVCCEILKHKPFRIYQKKHNVYPLTGIMAENSQQRQGNYLKYGCNILNGKTSIGRPLSIWTDADVWAYIKRFNVPYCDVYNKGEHNTGCAYCGFGCHLEKESRFERLKIREPKRFSQMVNLENNGVKYLDAINSILDTVGKKNIQL
jgi:3'-phosphoadenosine 5'-phosphosulfate sulfotransferase (PAPS reductase)/FAD synthetase